MENKPVAIILAAGQSTRFGKEDKLLYPYKGKALIDHAIAPMVEAGLEPVVALADDNIALKDHLEQQRVSTLCVPDAARGMGHTLKYAIRAHSRANGWIIALGDMPNVSSIVYRKLINLLQTTTIVACNNKDIFLPPIAFSRTQYTTLMAINDTKGARAVVKSNQETAYVAIPSESITDIDTSEDLYAI